MMDLGARRAGTTSVAIADQLRDEIVAGRLRPGSALRQEAIARQLGVSRMPVRDALNQLQAEGLVDLLPNRGAFVATLSLEKCTELFDLRVMLECDALERAVPRHTERSLRHLEFAQSELEAAEGVQLWAAGDRRFHELLYEPCGRPRTRRINGELRNEVQRFYHASLSPHEHRSGWKGEHRDILRAVNDRDANAACEALRRHLRITQSIVAKALEPRG